MLIQIISLKVPEKLIERNKNIKVISSRVRAIDYSLKDNDGSIQYTLHYDGTHKDFINNRMLKY